MKRLLVIAMLVFIAVGCTKKEGATPQADNSLNSVMAKGTLVLGFDDSFPPMGFKQDGSYVGFDLDLGREVARRMGVELVLQPILWDVKEQELNTRQIDCIWNGFTMTPEREAAMSFTKPYMSNKQIIVVLADSPINTLADLSGKTVALQRNSSASDALAKFPDVKASLGQLLEFEDNLMAMTDLDAKACDAVVMDIVVANYNYMKKFPGKYRILGETLSDEFFGVGFRKNDIALKDKVEEMLLEMAADGSMAEISNNWFGADISILKKD